MTHAQSSKGLPSAANEGPPSRLIFLQGQGLPSPLQTEREELSSQRESHSLFLSPEDPSIAYFELLPWARCGNTGTNTLLTASVFEERGRQSRST